MYKILQYTHYFNYLYKINLYYYNNTHNKVKKINNFIFEYPSVSKIKSNFSPSYLLIGIFNLQEYSWVGGYQLKLS